MNGVFGMFAEKYYQDVPGKPGYRAIAPDPVIGQVYEYVPIALISETTGNPTFGVFRGFSEFGPAVFSPIGDGKEKRDGKSSWSQ